jgi:hypothetical protein
MICYTISHAHSYLACVLQTAFRIQSTSDGVMENQLKRKKQQTGRQGGGSKPKAARTKATAKRARAPPSAPPSAPRSTSPRFDLQLNENLEETLSASSSSDEEGSVAAGGGGGGARSPFYASCDMERQLEADALDLEDQSGDSDDDSSAPAALASAAAAAVAPLASSAEECLWSKAVDAAVVEWPL